jgi:nitronate monooxygenase
MSFLDRLGIAHPIIQAPMAGTSTPELAAAVSNAGGLGSLGVAATDSAGARKMIEALQRLTNRAFNVNVFVHKTPKPDPVKEAAWLKALAPEFQRFNAEPPKTIRPIYTSFADDDDMLATLVDLAPPIVSLHFGIPAPARIAALKAAGCILLSTATNLQEAEAAKKAGVDAIVAQGVEAGGHRGVFDTEAPDDRLGTMALTRMLAVRSGLPVIAAGGIMDGQGISAALNLGAVAAQLGTAFVACPESSADEHYRKALLAPGAHTTFTKAISGRLARGLHNSFTAWGEANAALDAPDYPIPYDAGKALIAAARAAGDGRYGAQWAGQGVALARAMPAAQLMGALISEMKR